MLPPIFGLRSAILLFLIVASSGYVIPTNIYLGGIFQSFSYINGSLVVSNSGSQHLSTFLMAVEEINNRSDLLGSTKLGFVINQGSTLAVPLDSNNYYQGATAAYDVVVSSPDVMSGVVISADMQNTRAASQILTDWAVPNFISKSTDQSVELTTSSSSPTLTLQMPPLSSYQSVVIRDWLPWKEVGIFYTSDSFGITAYNNYRLNLPSDYYIHFSYAIPPDTKDFSSYVREAKKIGTTIFLVFMDAPSTGLLLESGYLANLFTQNTQVVGTSEAASSEIWKAMSPHANIPAIMTGYLTMQVTPELFFETTTGRSFLDRFRQLRPTYFPQWSNCSTAQDDGKSNSKTKHNRALYQVPSRLNESSSTFSTNTSCIGIESYDVFNSNGSNVDPSILYTYDAVYSFAAAADSLIRQQLPVTGSTVANYLFSLDVSTTGITGNISFNPSSDSENYFNRGERLSAGTIFTLLNFDIATFLDSNGSLGFVNVGYYDAKSGGLKLCKDITENNDIQIENCKEIRYRTNGGGSIPPTGTKVDLHKFVAIGLRVLFLLMSFVMAIAQFYQMYFVCHNFHEREVRNAQPKILIVMLLGGFSGTIWMLFNAFPIKKGVCVAQFWTGHIMLLATFIPFQLKLWRIHKIVSATPFTRIRISENSILKFLTAIMVMSLAFVVTITFVGDVNVRYVTTYHNKQRTLEPYCAPPHSPLGRAMYYILIAYELTLLLSAMRFMWLTRGVPSYINEISTIGPIFVGSSFVVLGAVLIYYLVPMSLDEQFVVINTTVFAVLCFGTGSYFYHKRKRLVLRKQSPNEFAAFALAGLAGNNGSPRMGGGFLRLLDPEHNAPLFRFQLERQDSEDSTWDGILFVNSMLEARADLLSKAKLCQEQLYLWTSVLLKLKEMEEEEKSYLAKMGRLDSQAGEGEETLGDGGADRSNRRGSDSTASARISRAGTFGTTGTANRGTATTRTTTRQVNVAPPHHSQGASPNYDPQSYSYLSPNTSHHRVARSFSENDTISQAVTAAGAGAPRRSNDNAVDFKKNNVMTTPLTTVSVGKKDGNLGRIVGPDDADDKGYEGGVEGEDNGDILTARKQSSIKREIGQNNITFTNNDSNTNNNNNNNNNNNANVSRAYPVSSSSNSSNFARNRSEDIQATSRIA